MPRWHGLQGGKGPKYSRASYASKKRDEPAKEIFGDVRLFFHEAAARHRRLPENEMRLRLAVVEVAADDLSGENPLLRIDALAWVNGRGRGTGFGLADIAELLDVDPEEAKRAMLAQAEKAA